MRMALVITLLTIVTVSLIHLRRQEQLCQRDIQKLQISKKHLRRTQADQAVTLATLTAPDRIRDVVYRLGLDLDNAPQGDHVAAGPENHIAQPAGR